MNDELARRRDRLFEQVVETLPVFGGVSSFPEISEEALRRMNSLQLKKGDLLSSCGKEWLMESLPQGTVLEFTVQNWAP